MDFGVVISGDRAVALKFDQFPQQAHDRLLARITDLTAQLLARVQSAEPESHRQAAQRDGLVGLR